MIAHFALISHHHIIQLQPHAAVHSQCMLLHKCGHEQRHLGRAAALFLHPTLSGTYAQCTLLHKYERELRRLKADVAPLPHPTLEHTHPSARPQRTLLRKYERELRRLKAELQRRSRDLVDKRALLEAEDQKKRAEV